MALPRKALPKPAPKRAMAKTTLSTKGQVVIPKQLRDDLGMKDGDTLRVERDGDSVRLYPMLDTEAQLDVKAVSGMLRHLLVAKGNGEKNNIPPSQWDERIGEMLRREHARKRSYRQ